MRYTHYDSFAPLRQFHREIDRVWSAYKESEQPEAETTAWVPSVDVAENDGRWVLAAEIPGVDPAKIDITAEDGFLVISGEKPAAINEEGDTKRRAERVSGRFYRRFKLPEQTDVEHISARTEFGVLFVSIPKLEEKQPHRIQVNVA